MIAGVITTLKINELLLHLAQNLMIHNLGKKKNLFVFPFSSNSILLLVFKFIFLFLCYLREGGSDFLVDFRIFLVPLHIFQFSSVTNTEFWIH